ncbi:hypothetical protein ANCDUO_09937 [Ancylostoma duodenale]|uniref:Uncharacterized protein n=1 Tax=Ancylostoma duodenale TaxID=51022 RepID=A0A0C2CSL5_9BILA|nr:hypothetical protein ANCDUO_09937 [Ancylostoma duodenale]
MRNGRSATINRNSSLSVHSTEWSATSMTISKRTWTLPSAPASHT